METSSEMEKPKQENPNSTSTSKPKIVVIMGPTGAGKSKLAVDLASYFPVEIINADSMQVYQGLDVLTNKVSLHEQRGVPHHLMGTVSPDREFTARDFRDLAMPVIDDICSRSCVPIIVGGTNYYIQALVSPFLSDDSIEDMDECCLSNPPGDKKMSSEFEFVRENLSFSYKCLKEVDPVAASRIHPNDQRKISQYLNLYTRFGVPPSKLFQGPDMEKWGRVDNFRFNCCFVCVDAFLYAIDQYVEQRVDRMIDMGLLNEVYDIYNSQADYTRGLRQAIGVREFENFLRLYKGGNDNGEVHCQVESDMCDEMLKENIHAILNANNGNPQKLLLEEAISKVKLNTRRLIRRQKRRLHRLHMLFGWNIQFIDTTDSLLGSSDNAWMETVVDPAVKIIRSFIQSDSNLTSHREAKNASEDLKQPQRDLWTQFICKACGDKVLRGAHEWEQHTKGRSHRKRLYRLKKSAGFCSFEQQA